MFKLVDVGTEFINCRCQVHGAHPDFRLRYQKTWADAVLQSVEGMEGSPGLVRFVAVIGASLPFLAPSLRFLHGGGSPHSFKTR